MGSVPNHSHSSPQLNHALTPESSQFIDKIQNMKFNNSKNKFIKNKAETQLQIAKALNVLKKNKYLFAENQTISVKQENRAFKYKRAITQSTIQLKLPHISSKKGPLTKDISMKVKKVRSSSNNQLFVNPKTVIHRNLCETEGYE